MNRKLTLKALELTSFTTTKAAKVKGGFIIWDDANRGEESSSTVPVGC